MRSQLARYSGFYAAVFLVAFGIGWRAARFVEDRIDKFDPRIGEGKYGW